MQEDKKLKVLLMKWAEEKPSADFTRQVMQRVTSVSTSKSPAQLLPRQLVPQVLLVAFILVCVALLSIVIITPGNALPFQFYIKLPAAYITQCVYFLITFWTVIVLQLAFKKFPIYFSNAGR